MVTEKMATVVVADGGDDGNAPGNRSSDLSDYDMMIKLIDDLGLQPVADDRLDNRTGLEDRSASDLNDRYFVFIILAAVLFTIGLVANLAVVFRLLRQGVLRARIRLLLLSLSCADVLLIVVEFPINQFLWMDTVYWKIGDVGCRLSSFSRAFASYLISYILVVISLDRCLNTVKPAAPKAASNRTKKLLWTALLFALLCALPQLIVFHAAPVPGNPDDVQCVSRGLTETNNMVKVVYPLFCMICQYVLPVALILLDYAIILYTMSKPMGRSDMQQLILFRQTSAVNGNASRHNSSQDSYIRKAQMKTLRILLATVLVFCLCWLPYYIVMLLHLSCDTEQKCFHPFWTYKLAELIAVANACLNPLIYGNYLLKVKERCKSCWSFH